MLHIGQYEDVLRTLHWDGLRTSYFNVGKGRPKSLDRGHIQDHMGMSIGRLFGTFLSTVLLQMSQINLRRGGSYT